MPTRDIAPRPLLFPSIPLRFNPSGHIRHHTRSPPSLPLLFSSFFSFIVLLAAFRAFPILVFPSTGGHTASYRRSSSRSIYLLALFLFYRRRRVIGTARAKRAN